MFKTPYETTVLSGHLMTKTINTLKQALVMESLVRPVPELKTIYAVTGKGIEVQKIPAFTHPISIEHRGEELLVVDLRPYDNTLTQLPTGIDIAPGTPAAFVFKLTTLQMIWQQNSDRFTVLLDLPLAIYASWVSNTLTSRLSLDPAVSLQVRALAAWFFICLHNRDLGTDDHSIAPKVLKISTQTSVPAETVISVIRQAGYLKSLTDFCEALNGLPSAKLERVTPAVVIQALGNSWLGTADPRALVAVGLEFPPYFYAMVHSVVTERYFRKSTISTVAENFNRNDRFKQFDLQLRRLLVGE